MDQQGNYARERTIDQRAPKEHRAISDEDDFEMPYPILCNGVQREGAKLSPALASELFCSVPLHNIWYGIRF